MKIIGITGGIGSGKSIVCAIFSKLGVPVYESDKEVHNLYDKHPDLKDKIVKEISDEVIDKTGKINRKKLSEVVFGNPKKLEQLNAMVHPLVRADFLKWSERWKGNPYVLKEAAILFESGADKDCDKIITVLAPVELRITRIRERDNKSRAETEAVISRQMSDEEKINKSDFLIHNDEKQMLIPQVLKIHALLSK